MAGDDAVQVVVVEALGLGVEQVLAAVEGAGRVPLVAQGLEVAAELGGGVELLEEAAEGVVAALGLGAVAEALLGDAAGVVGGLEGPEQLVVGALEGLELAGLGVEVADEEGFCQVGLGVVDRVEAVVGVVGKVEVVGFAGDDFGEGADPASRIVWARTPAW